MTFDAAYNRILRLMEYPAAWGGSAAQQEAVADVMGYWARIVWENAEWSGLVQYAERSIVVDADGISTVPLVASGETRIGSVFGVYDIDPRTAYNAQAFAYEVGLQNISLGIADTDTDTVWIRFRVPPPQFTRVAYNGATAYVVGDVVYDSTTGQSYYCIQAGTGNAVTDTDYWEVQTVPDFMWEVIVRGAFAELLRNDGRGDRADTEEARALAELDRAVLAQEEQQGHVSQFHFHVTR